MNEQNNNYTPEQMPVNEQIPNQAPNQYVNQYPNMQNNQQEKIYDVNVVSMILGIWAIVTVCVYYLSIPSSIGGIILAAIGMKSNRRGKGFAIAGLVLSIIALALWGILFMIGFSISSALG